MRNNDNHIIELSEIYVDKKSLTNQEIDRDEDAFQMFRSAVLGTIAFYLIGGALISFMLLMSGCTVTVDVKSPFAHQDELMADDRIALDDLLNDEAL